MREIQTDVSLLHSHSILAALENQGLNYCLDESKGTKIQSWLT